MRLSQETKTEPAITGTHRRLAFFLGIPTFGKVSIEWAISISRLQLPMNCMTISLVAKGLEIGNARQWLAENFLASEAKYLLFIGDDNISEWDSLLRLYEVMESDPSWDILSGVYHLKQATIPQIVAWNFDSDGPIRPGRDFQPGEIIQVDVTGLDFCLIRRETLLRLEKESVKPWFKTSSIEDLMRPDGGMSIYTEDAYFFRKCKELGIKTGLHTGCLIGHYDMNKGVMY